MSPFKRGLAAMALAWCLGCAQEPGELVLAEVGGAPITEGEFNEFDARIPDGMKQGDTPAAARRQVLESLIDKKLLLLEAADAGIAEDAWFKAESADFERRQLMEMYIAREVVAKTVVTQGDIELHHRESGRHRALRLGGIMVEREEEARNIVAQLEAGADFHALAREHSIHEESAARGGDSGIYQIRDQLSEQTVAQVLGLAIGEISAPVREVFAHEDFYVVYKILDEIPAPLSASQDIIVEELLGIKRQERLQALSDSLVAAYAPQPDAAAIGRFAAADADPNAAAGSTVLCAYRDGELTVDGFATAYKRMLGREPAGIDSARVVDFLHRRVLPDLFFAAEIAAAGIAGEEHFKRILAFKREELMLSALRRREVDRLVSVSEDEARAFYEAHPEKFTEPETTTIVEILADSDSLARRLGDEMRAGADAVGLAKRHTRREGALHHEGTIQLNTYSQGFFPVLAKAVGEVGVGAVGGPVRTEQGHSVFKVLERKSVLTPYNAESQRRARAYVQIDKSRRSYVEFVRNLRHKFPVKVIEGNLEKIGAPQS